MPNHWLERRFGPLRRFLGDCERWRKAMCTARITANAPRSRGAVFNLALLRGIPKPSNAGGLPIAVPKMQQRPRSRFALAQLKTRISPSRPVAPQMASATLKAADWTPERNVPCTKRASHGNTRNGRPARRPARRSGRTGRRLGQSPRTLKSLKYSIGLAQASQTSFP